MPRTKGNKNKPKVTNDCASQITEKQEAIASLNIEITSITANIDALKRRKQRQMPRLLKKLRRPKQRLC